MILCSKIVCIVGMVLAKLRFSPAAFIRTTTSRTRTFTKSNLSTNSKTQRFSFLRELWDEVIEFSTLGPGERKLLKQRRIQNASKREGGSNIDDKFSLRSFQAAKERDCKMNSEDVNMDLNGTLAKEVTGLTTGMEPVQDVDGYALCDLLVARWGAPLDVDFVRQNNAVYCSVMPVSFGSRKCRHINKLDYLMHLQGIVEVLRAYRNLDPFIMFLLTTNKKPKAGTNAVLFRLQLSDEQRNHILSS
jgi:hypothetical protein